MCMPFSGTCTCYENFFDEDCGLSIQTTPIIAGIPDHGDCDITQRECAKTSVMGYGWVESPKLSCKMTPFQVGLHNLRSNNIKVVYVGNCVSLKKKQDFKIF